MRTAEVAFANHLMNQIGGGELRDFATEDDPGAERSFLRPLSPPVYPQTEEAAAILTGLTSDGGMGFSLGPILGSVIGAVFPGLVPTPPPAQAAPVASAATPGMTAAEVMALMEATKAKGLPTWAWLAIGGGGVAVLSLVLFLVLRK